MKKRRRTDDEQLFEDKEKNKKREQLFFTFTREMQTHSRLVGFDLSFFFLRVRCSRVLISFLSIRLEEELINISRTLFQIVSCVLFSRENKKEENIKETHRRKREKDCLESFAFIEQRTKKTFRFSFTAT